MTDNYSLTGPFIQGDKSKKVQNIIIMLHGYGSNGDDLIQIAYEWKEKFPNIFFSAPNAPFNFNELNKSYSCFFYSNSSISL